MLLFDHDGLRFHYRDAGQGLRFIFQHGLGGFHLDHLQGGGERHLQATVSRNAAEVDTAPKTPFCILTIFRAAS